MFPSFTRLSFFARLSSIGGLAFVIAATSVLACTPDEDKLRPFANVLRSDAEIDVALRKAQAEDKQLHPYERTMIIMWGVFGPCFVLTLEEGQMVAWRTYKEEVEADRSRDTREAVENMSRVVRLLRRHKIPDDIRPANIDFDLYLPVGYGKSRKALYRIHFSPIVIRRAKNSQGDPAKQLNDGFKVYDGELPDDLRHPYGRR